MIPNILTTFRLIIIPFFAYFMFKGNSFLVPAALFLLSGLTDVLDGWIARRYNMITDVGRVYDPLVDKLMQLTAVLSLAIKGIIPFWIIAIIALKEISMIVAGTILYAKKIVVSSNWYGKAATVFFYAVVLILMIFPNISLILKSILLILLVIVVVITALAYLVKISARDESICRKKA